MGRSRQRREEQHNTAQTDSKTMSLNMNSPVKFQAIGLVDKLHLTTSGVVKKNDQVMTKATIPISEPMAFSPTLPIHSETRRAYCRVVSWFRNHDFPSDPVASDRQLLTLSGLQAQEFLQKRQTTVHDAEGSTTSVASPCTLSPTGRVN